MSLKIVLHDFGGYPFVTALGRELARRGHTVAHVFNARLTAGQDVEPRYSDPPTFRLVPIRTRRHFDKYSLSRRLPIENEYGRLVASVIRQLVPDVVLSANAPLVSQLRIIGAARSCDAPFVYWLQDLLGVGISGEIQRRFGRLGGGTLGVGVEALEGHLLKRSDHIVSIASNFDPVLDRWGVDRSRRSTISNWAPLDGTPQMAALRGWQREVGLPDRPTVLYAGTLGRKHDPALLLHLAAELSGEAQVVVVSEGPFADRLAASAGSQRLTNLVIIPFQPIATVPSMLASADVLVALLTADASNFSVPSKVLTYLAAGRPIVAVMPPDNPAAEILQQHRAGLVVDAGESASFIEAVRSLIRNPGMAAAMGSRGRGYAEDHFNIGLIGDRFEELLAAVVTDA